VAEALRIGGASTLDEISPTTRAAAASDPDAARGKLIAISGRATLERREGPYSAGTLMTAAGPIHFVTPFTPPQPAETVARFRGVFVQRYASALVLVGTFDP
jgi:hypothetical protein